MAASERTIGSGRRWNRVGGPRWLAVKVLHRPGWRRRPWIVLRDYGRDGNDVSFKAKTEAEAVDFATAEWASIEDEHIYCVSDPNTRSHPYATPQDTADWEATQQGTVT